MANKEAQQAKRFEELAVKEARQAKRFRRFSIVLAAALALAVMATALAAVALWLRAKSRARELISASIVNQNIDPEIAVLLAAQAVATTWPFAHAILPENEQLLHDAILASHVRQTLAAHPKGVRSRGLESGRHTVSNGQLGRYGQGLEPRERQRDLRSER